VGRLRIAAVVPVRAAPDADLDALRRVHRTSLNHVAAWSRAGAEAHLLVHGPRAATVTIDGATLHVLPKWRRGAALIGAAEALRPDVLHLFHLLAWRVAAAAAVSGVRVFAEYNGGAPPRSRIARWLLADATDAFAGLFFTAAANAEPLLDAGALSPRTPIFEVPEVASDLPIAERRGRKMVLVVSRFHADKDPDCAADALERIASRRPDLKLVWASLDDRGSQAFLRRLPDGLRRRLELRFALTPAEMAELYANAAVLLHTSLREVCGYAFVEALAAGVPIAASDIPPFRAMGTTSAVSLCKPGDAGAFAAAALRLIEDRCAGDVARAHYAAELSYDANARRRVAVYRGAP